MNQMSTMYQHVSRPRFIREHIEIIRSRENGGEIRCDTCHGPALGRGEFAQIVGVSPSTLAKWLRCEPIRQDIADKIRSAVKEVRE